jgi:outer membrane lipoprotein SlyB
MIKMKKDALNIKMIPIAMIVGALAGGIVAFAIVQNTLNQEPTEEDLIKEFYDIENAVSVSPHGSRKSL